MRLVLARVEGWRDIGRRAGECDHHLCAAFAEAPCRVRLGGDPDLQRAIRVHANFIEYPPFALLLLLLVEMTTAYDDMTSVVAVGGVMP